MEKELVLNTITRRVSYLKKFDSFLFEEGYIQPELISGSLIEKFITISSQQERQSTITYVSTLWAEEQWLKLPYTPRKYKTKTPSIKAIPEEVLHQIYENLDLFPCPLERLFRLQLVLGCRIGEMLRMPRQCLKKEGEQWFLKRWVQKRKHWRFYQVHPTVAELVREQQKFLEKQLGSNSEFDKLFCKLSTALHDGVEGIKKTGMKRFDVEPVYFPSVLTYGSVCCWLQDFREIANFNR